jgi:hypothetical protein
MTEYRCVADAGAAAELLASAWLIGFGYQVFRNLSAAGPADLVAWCPETSETLFVDVKSANSILTRADGQHIFPLRSAGKYRNDVHYLFVVNGKVVGFVRHADIKGSREIYFPARANRESMTV